MPKIKTSLALLALLAVAGSALIAPPARSKEFTFDEKANKEIARKLNIPVYFAVPASARGEVPKDIDAAGRLIDFKHPDGKGAQGDVGLRLVVTNRSDLARRLGKSGLIKTGDLLLTFRSEWGGAGAYPSVQLGISHTGVAYVKDGVVHNLDNPLNEEYLGPGMRGELTGAHYGTLKFIHVIRPRGLTEAQRANLLEWATRLNSGARRIYPKQIAFNQDYNAPKYKRGRSGRLRQASGPVGAGAEPARHRRHVLLGVCLVAPGAQKLRPAQGCRRVHTLGHPVLREAGDEPHARHGRLHQPARPLVLHRPRRGAADGDRFPEAARRRARQAAAFGVRGQPGGMSKMSEGHRKVAQSMSPKFAPLEEYYVGVNGSFTAGWKARMISNAFNKAIPENYSPTSFLINTLLPSNNANRTMDYIATIMID